MNNELRAIGFQNQGGIVETNLNNITKRHIEEVTGNKGYLNDLKRLIINMLTDKNYVDNTMLSHSVQNETGGSYSLVVSKEYFGKDGKAVYLPKIYFLNTDLSNSVKVKQMTSFVGGLANNRGVYDNIDSTLEDSIFLLGSIFNDIFGALQTQPRGNYNVTLDENFYILVSETNALTLHFTGKFKMLFKNDVGLQPGYSFN